MSAAPAWSDETELDDLERELAEIELREIEMIEELQRAERDPAFLLQHTKMVDEKTGEVFTFVPADTPRDDGWAKGAADSWAWQLDLLDWIQANQQMIILKARQIGVSWIALGYALWLMLFKPGIKVLIYRQTEDDARESLLRVWEMYHNLPVHLRNGTKVSKPARATMPSDEFWLEHADGTNSKIEAKPATPGAAHGTTAGYLIIDEAARVEALEDIMSAAGPALGSGNTKVVLISTANGGEGNTYHDYWVNAVERLFESKFLGWMMHPDRDQDWYENSAEIRRLTPRKRAEQYPSNPVEAFLMTGDKFFDPKDLEWYRDNAIAEPLFRFNFVKGDKPGTAKINKEPFGKISVFEKPEKGCKYAIAADVATGRGTDFSVAYVINLATGELVAQFRAKCTAEEYAFALHFLGRYYRNRETDKPAVIAVEMGGGYGEPIVVLMRNRTDGRPIYSNLYRHRIEDRSNKPERRDFGFPMNEKTRPLVISGIEEAVAQHSFERVSPELMHEMNSFVRWETRPYERAAKGCNDDCVMAWAIALDLYRRFGSYRTKKLKEREQKKSAVRKSKPRTLVPWHPQHGVSPLESGRYGKSSSAAGRGPSGS